METYSLELHQRPFDSATQGLCGSLRTILFQIPESVKEKAQEIRLRANRPIAVYTGRETYFVKEQGRLTQRFDRTLPVVSSQEILNSFHHCCSYSVYSHQHEIRQGYVTMAGGHRVGVCGTAVYEEKDVSGIRDISSLNIRIAREVYGAADELLRALGEEFSGFLIAGPPASGKTTILRDIARQLSLRGKKVVVIDERGELGGTFQGVCQNDLGLCDVLTGFPKGEGILQAIRCLSPEFIVCDEAGSRREIAAIDEGLNAWVGLITTLHAGSLEEIYRRSQGLQLLQSGAFHKIVLLEGRSMPGTVQGIYKVGDPDDKNDRLSSHRADRGRDWVSAI